MLSRLIIASVATCTMATGALAWDGARAYHLRPVGGSDISLTSTYLHKDGTIDLGGPVEGTEVDAWALTPTYRKTLDLFGNAGAVLIGMPVGSASFLSSAGTIDMQTDLSHGDLFVGGVWGLVGSPALSPMEYAQHKPGFRASLAGRLFLPTGDYDADRIVNLGANRWSLVASLPMSYVLGSTMIDPELMTFEVRPMVHIFGDNDDPFGPATLLSQDPTYGVEAHVTRNFGNDLWASLDGYYQVAGETYADGVALGTEEATLELGATLGITLSPSVALRLTYREQVYSDRADSDGRSLELVSAFLF